MIAAKIYYSQNKGRLILKTLHSYGMITNTGELNPPFLYSVIFKLSGVYASTNLLHLFCLLFPCFPHFSFLILLFHTVLHRYLSLLL